MFCRRCGAEVTPHAAFCRRCGTEVKVQGTQGPGLASVEDEILEEDSAVPTSRASGPETMEAMPVSSDAANQESKSPIVALQARASTLRSQRFWLGVLAILLAVTAATLIYIYHRHLGLPAPVSDDDIVQSIRAKFSADPNLSKCTVQVKSEHGVVTLTGLVNSTTDISTATELALRQAGVKTVVDNMVLAPSPLGVLSNVAKAAEQILKTAASSAGQMQLPVIKTLVVPGDRPWTATGVFLVAGNVVQISASGGVSFSAGSKPEPPAGDPPDCLTVASGPYGWKAAPYVANKLPCTSLLARVGENGVVFYVGAGTTFKAATSGQLYLGVNDNNFGDNSGFWTAIIAVNTNLPSTAAAQETWLGFANGNVAQDRDVELHRNCGEFIRVYVPDSAGNKFSDLCGYVGRRCESVCDWEGRNLPCDAVSQGGHRDGTRVALCR